MFKAKVPLPLGVVVERLYDKKEVDNGNASITFFPSNATNVDTDNNYTSNPLPDNVNHVVLGISIDLLTKAIRLDANIDPVYILNNLNDSIFKLTTNSGRDRAILNPLKDYLNFSGVQLAQSYDSATPQTDQTIVIPSTGIRFPDNLFYIGKNEQFTPKIEFNSAVWPTVANWTAAGTGRFGFLFEMWVAKMTDEQLAAYTRSLQSAAG